MSTQDNTAIFDAAVAYATRMGGAKLSSVLKKLSESHEGVDADLFIVAVADEADPESVSYNLTPECKAHGGLTALVWMVPGADDVQVMMLPTGTEVIDLSDEDTDADADADADAEAAEEEGVEGAEIGLHACDGFVTLYVPPAAAGTQSEPLLGQRHLEVGGAIADKHDREKEGHEAQVYGLIPIHVEYTATLAAPMRGGSMLSSLADAMGNGGSSDTGEEEDQG